MGLGQSMLSVLAMALLGTIVLGVNRNTADNGTVIERTEYQIMATSLGISTSSGRPASPSTRTPSTADVATATSCTPLASLGTGDRRGGFHVRRFRRLQRVQQDR